MSRPRFTVAANALRKAFRMVWSGLGSGASWLYAGRLYGTLPGAKMDYGQLAGDATKNSVVSIALGWIGDNFPEPLFQIGVPGAGGLVEPVASHPLLDLVDCPNEFVDRDSLLAALAMDYSASGNGYLYKARSRYGEVLELWWVPSWQIRPYWGSEREFIGSYVYTVNGRDYPLPRADVVHIRFGQDADNPRLGVNRLTPVLREVVAINAVATTFAALMRNRGIPGVLLTPKGPDVEIRADVAKLMQEEWQDRYSGEGTGKPFIPRYPMEVARLALSAQEMDLAALASIPERKVCSALRIPALLLHLHEERATFNNLKTAKKQGYEECLQPIGRRFARAFDHQLLSEWEPKGTRLRCGWDYSPVAALQEERTEVFRQNTMAVRGGWLTVNQALQRAGFAPVPGQDIFLRGGGGSPGGGNALASGEAPQADGTPSEAGNGVGAGAGL